MAYIIIQDDGCLEYIKGRKYVKNVVSKGKKVYLREGRTADGIPLSHEKLKDFLIVQNRDLTDYIKECIEYVKEDSDDEKEESKDGSEESEDEMEIEELEDISSDSDIEMLEDSNLNVLESEADEEEEIEEETDDE